MSALDVTPDTALAAIRAGATDVYDLAARFHVLSTSPGLGDALDQLGVTVDAEGRLHGAVVFVQPTLDEQETT